MKWYIPSTHGDLRLIPDPNDAARTLLEIVKPTAEEQQIVNAIGKASLAKGWLQTWEDFAAGTGPLAADRWTLTLNAPVADVGLVAQSLMTPGIAVLTAIQISGGKVIASSGSTAQLAEDLAEAQRVAAAAAPAPTKAPQAAAEKPKTEPEAAASVRRPTPSCPACQPGSIGPATEVLLTFLSPEQHRQWAKEREIVVYGGLTGEPYLLSHRHHRRAIRNGRICQTLGAKPVVVHFHQRWVPPEEEVLAAMLILQHREPWLRNEATLFHVEDDAMLRFKNPFGDVLDGAHDAVFMKALGIVVQASARVPRAKATSLIH